MILKKNLIVVEHNLKHKSIEVMTMATVSAVVGSIISELVYVYKGKKSTTEERITSFGIGFVAAAIVQVLVIKSKN